MKRKSTELARHYALALHTHLRQGARASLQPALRLGRTAVLAGIETLELARIHEQALITLKGAGERSGLLERAERFFTEALTPIIETHRAVRRSRADLKRMNEVLVRRTAELAVTHRQLQRGIVRRRTVEAALRKSGIHYTRLLRESLRLQEGLRQLTHRVLSAQEDERKNISRELQDEIAQTLLGINVRLHSLKRESKSNTRELRHQIATTQRLVTVSAKSVRRFAREYRRS